MNISTFHFRAKTPNYQIPTSFFLKTNGKASTAISFRLNVKRYSTIATETPPVGQIFKPKKDAVKEALELLLIKEEIPTSPKEGSFFSRKSTHGLFKKASTQQPILGQIKRKELSRKEIITQSLRLDSDPKLIIELKGILMEEKIKPEIDIYNYVLLWLANGKHLLHLRAQYEMMKKEKIQPNLKTFSILIDAYSRNLEAVAEVYDDMIKAQVMPDATIFASLVRAFGNFDDVEGMARVFETMVNKGVDPNNETYDALIRAFFNNSRFENVSRVYEQIKDKDALKLSEKSILSIVKSLQYIGKWQEVLNIYDDMKSRQQIIGPEVYTAVINCLREKGAEHYDYIIRIRGITPSTGTSKDLEDVYDEMKSKPFGDMIAYNVLMNQLLLFNDSLKLTQKIVKDLRSRGLPMVELSQIIVKLYEKFGHNEGIISLWNEVKNENKSLSTNLFTSLVRAYLVKRETGPLKALADQAMEIFSDVSTIYGQIFHIISHNESLHLGGLMLELYHHMEARGIVPTLDIKRMLVKVMGKEHRHDVIKDLYQKMKETEPKFDLTTYNVLINAFVKCENFDMVMKLYNELMEIGLKPDGYTYAALFNALSKKGHSDQMLALFQKMKEEGVVVEVPSYNNLIHSLGNAGALDKMLDIYDEMKAAKMKPDVNTYGFLIDIFGKNDKLDQIFPLLNSMIQDGLQPNVACFGTLIQIYFRTNDIRIGRILISEVRNWGLTILGSTCSKMLFSLTIGQHVDEAMKLYDYMQEEGYPLSTTEASALIKLVKEKGKEEDLTRILNHRKTTA